MPRLTPRSAGLGDRAARGAGITLAGQGLRAVVRFGGMVVLARLLTPTDFGLVAMVAAVIGVSDLIRDFGLSSAAIQAKELSDAERTNLFWVNTALGAVCTVVMAAAAPLIVLIYGRPELTPIVLVMSTAFVISGANTQFRAELTRNLRFNALAAADVVSVVGGFSIGIITALLGAGFWALVAQQLSAIVFECVLNVVNTRWRPGLPQRGVSIRRFLRFGLGLLGANLLSYATRNVDNLSLGIVWGAGPLGLYDRAYQLVVTPLNQINTPMTRVALPVLSRVQDDPPRFARALDRAQLVGAYLTTTVFAVSAGLAAPLVLVLFGPAWTASAAIFAALCIGGVFRALANISYWIYVSTGRTGAQFKMFLATRPLMVAIILAGLPWGPVGVAFSSSAAYLLHFLVSNWRAGVVTGVDTRRLMRKALSTIFLMTAPSGVVALLATFLPVPAIVQLVLGVLFAGVYYLAAAALVPAVRRDLGIVLTYVVRMAGGRARRGPLLALTNAATGFARDRARKSDMASLLRAASPHARGGRWSIVSGTVARHRSVSASGTGRPQPALSLKQRLVALRLAAAGPRSVRLAGSHGTAVEARRTKTGGVVLFDHDGRRVVHVRHDPLPETYAAHRELLSSRLPSPAWSLSADRRVLEEGLVDGVPLLHAAPEVRIRIARALLAASAESISGSSRDSSEPMLIAAIDRVSAEAVGTAVTDQELAALRSQVRNLASSWPVALGHGDLTGLNVLVAAGSWTVIDFEDAGWQPYFFDAYSLLMRDPVLVRAVHEGAFTTELRNLHRSAGTLEDQDDELLLRLTAILASARYAEEHGGALSEALGKLWPARDVVA